MIHLDYRDGRPIYAQITEQFKRRIGAGILRTGDKLPSVRELAGELAINPNTIQRAYRELEQQGWIVTVSGKGCFVSRDKEDDSQLWQALEQAAAALLAQGVTTEQLLCHLEKGGKDHA